MACNVTPNDSSPAQENHDAIRGRAIMKRKYMMRQITAEVESQDSLEEHIRTFGTIPTVRKMTKVEITMKMVKMTNNISDTQTR